MSWASRAASTARRWTGRDGSPRYLPQQSSPEAAATRYRLGGGVLRLLIEADQPPRVPGVRRADQVSSPQTGVVSGPVSSIVGQSRFKPGLAVREGRDNPRLHMP
jgi:hypothetical protein